ncbi:MAG TPA: PilZ domain-containing protein [Candidatus Acidoferrales bacterium]
MTSAALRRHERISVPPGIEIHAAGHGLAGVATVIGMGGMFLRAKDMQPPGTALLLKLTCAATLIDVGCTVRYVTDHGMGIEFTTITAGNDQKLLNLLDQVRTKS